MKERRRRAPWIHQHSAGGVIVRTDVPEPLFLAIKPANRDRWQLPKGTIDPGESPQEAAVREVREEGGVSGRIVAPLEPIRFFYQMHGKRFAKTVDFFLMEYQAGDPADHDDEVQDAHWFPLSDSGRLAFPTERAVVEQARQILAMGGS